MAEHHLKKLINQLNSIFYSFIWNGHPDKIKRNISKQKVINGGLGMTDIHAFDQSLKLTWIRKLFTNESKWKSLIESLYPDLLEVYKFGNTYLTKIKNNIKNPFWNDVTSAFLQFTEKYYLEANVNTKWCSFLYNNKIKIGNQSIKNKSFIDNHIYYIYQLMHEDKFLTHDEFINKFNINIDFLQYNSVISAIKNYQSKYQTTTDSKKPDFQPHFDIIMKCKRGTSNIQQHIIAEKSVITGQQKWHNVLNISKDDWFKSFRILKFTTTDTKLLWFQIRILHHILTTNRSTSKFRTNQTDLCEFCGSHSETIQHLIWKCSKVKIFWKDLFSILKRRYSHLTNIQPSENLILFGHNINITFDNIFLLIILMAKFYIYTEIKYKKTTLHARIFLNEVYNRYRIEMHIQKNSQNFEKAWAPYLLLFKSLL